MLVLLSVLLLSSYVLPLIQSQTCNETTEYFKENRCCKKCKPGESMEERCKEGSHDTVCEPCLDGFYMDVFNEYYRWCKNCKMCTKEHVKYKEHCTPTSDAVCTCDEGYKCSDSTCQKCVKVQTSTTSPRPAPTETPPHTQKMKNKNCTLTIDGVYTRDEGYRCLDSTCQVCVKVQTTTTSPRPAPTKTQPHTQNNVWISVSLCFACVCVCVLFTCFLLISRHGRPLGWIMSLSADFLLSKKRHSSSSECTQEEEIPMPVQEVCGKEEKLEDD